VPREALIIEARGERFRFYYEGGNADLLHITFQHGASPDDAIQAFFSGGPGTWNEERSRFELLTESHGVYWTRYAADQSVIIITCFRRGDER